MKRTLGALLFVSILVSPAARCAEGPPGSPVLIYRCSANCKGLWWDEYRRRPLRVQEYWQPDRLPDGRVGSAYGGRFLEALDTSGNRAETIWEVSATNVALDIIFVDGGSKLIVVSTDGGYSCATTTVSLHDLRWPPSRSEVLLEPSEVMCDGYLVQAAHANAVHLPVVGTVVPSEDGRVLANSFMTGNSLTGKTQLVDLDARKVVAETDGTVLGGVGPRAFYVAQPVYTEQRHLVRDFVLKEFSLEEVKSVGRADGIEKVVRGSGGQLLLGGTLKKIDIGQPHYDKPEAQVIEEKFKSGVKVSAQSAQRSAFPCKVLDTLNAWQEPSGQVVVSVEEQCNEKSGYALYRLPKP